MNQTEREAKSRFVVSDLITIVQRGKRAIWCAEYHWTNTHCRKSLRTSNRKIAEQRARELERDLMTGDVRPGLKPMGIEEAIGLFIDSKKTDDRSPKTLVKYEAELNTFAKFAKNRGVTTVQQLTLTLTDAFRKQRKQHDHLAPYTLYTNMVVIKTWTKWLRRRRHIAVDPLVDLEVEKPLRPRHAAATLDQINAIMGSATGYLLAVFGTAAFSGLRIGEVASLRVKDVDLVAGVVHVRRRDDWAPKTENAERSVPIHPRLLALLSEYDGHHKLGRGRRYFFTAPPSPRYPHGDHHINNCTVNQVLQKLADQHGYVVGRENRGLTEHSLRRTFKTVALESGVPGELVDLWIGHAGSNSINQHYFRPQSQKQEEWMSRVAFGDADPGEVARVRLEPEPVRRGRRPKSQARRQENSDPHESTAGADKAARPAHEYGVRRRVAAAAGISFLWLLRRTENEQVDKVFDGLHCGRHVDGWLCLGGLEPRTTHGRAHI